MEPGAMTSMKSSCTVIDSPQPPSAPAPSRWCQLATSRENTVNHPETLKQPYRLPCVLASALFLAPIAAVAATGEAPGSTLHRVSYQGKEMIAEVSDDDGHVFLQDDVLAFPSEVRLLGPATARTGIDTSSVASTIDPLVGTVRLWRRTQLKYAFNADVESSTRTQLRSAATIWGNNTSWQFIETASRADADIVVQRHATRCSATVGAPEAGKQASMKLSSNCDIRSVVHEFGHVVGMVHEHQRPAQNEHLILRQDTLQYIQQNYPDSTYRRVAAALRPLHYNPGQPHMFDSTSIMMYGSYPRHEPLRSDLMRQGLPFYTLRDGSLIEPSPARLSNKDIAIAEYLANLITTIHTLTPKY